MVERSEKGRQARQYFIEMERRAKLAVTPTLDLRDPKTLLHLLTQTAETAATLQATVQEQEPKVRFYDAVGASGDAQSIEQVAKTLGTGGRASSPSCAKAGFSWKIMFPISATSTPAISLCARGPTRTLPESRTHSSELWLQAAASPTSSGVGQIASSLPSRIPPGFPQENFGQAVPKTKESALTKVYGIGRVGSGANIGGSTWKQFCDSRQCRKRPDSAGRRFIRTRI